MKKKFKKVIAVVLTMAMAMSVSVPVFATEDSSDIANVMEETNIELIIPYKTYDEFASELKVLEVVETLPEGEAYCSNVMEFYEAIYGQNDGIMTIAEELRAEKKLGDLNAIFYATIEGSRFLSLDHVSSNISALYIGAEWEQEHYTHTFTDSYHVVSGDIYGSFSQYVATPLGFVRLGTNSFKVPYEISTSIFE